MHAGDMAYKLIHEGVIDHTDDWYTFVRETDGGADHGVSMYLYISNVESHDTSAGIWLTKLVVPSIGLCCQSLLQ